MIYDITPPITESLKVWPGDTPPSRQVLCDMKRGDNITLSTLHATVHLGAHADGPNHYGTHAPSIDQRPLELYIGLCQVIHVRAARKSRVTIADLRLEIADETKSDAGGAQQADSQSTIDNRQSTIRAERVLFATGTYPNPYQFHEDFAALSPALIDWLAERGVRLVGIDTPSVDLFDSKDLPAHHAILKHDMAILEGIVLSAVPEGVYELIALPLPLVGFDASPVRAVLRTLA